jgi:hypothetical protein
MLKSRLARWRMKSLMALSAGLPFSPVDMSEDYLPNDDNSKKPYDEVPDLASRSHMVRVEPIRTIAIQFDSTRSPPPPAA